MYLITYIYHILIVMKGIIINKGDRTRHNIYVCMYINIVLIYVYDKVRVRWCTCSL